MPLRERLPRRFEVRIEEHSDGSRTWVTQTFNGRLLGDQLTDNKGRPDDYRFHDVFHVAYAVHLGWSPVLRRLMQVKRKSDPQIDENQDGARAAIIEEGVATYIFGQALERHLFDGLDRDFRFACPGSHVYAPDRRPAHEILFVAQSSSSRGGDLNPRLTWNRLEPLLSWHSSDTDPHLCSCFARRTSLHSPRVSLPGPVAPRSSAACRRTAAGSDALLPAGASSTAHASPAGLQFSPTAAGDW